MVYLVLAITCSTLLGHLFKMAGLKGYSQPALFGVNYLMALVTSWLLIPGQREFVLPGAAFGAFVGILFVAGFFLFSYNVRLQGVGLASTYMRLSAIIPTLGSILLFQESPRVLQLVAMVLVFGGLFFAGPQLPWKNSPGEGQKALLWGLALFVGVGISDFSLKIKTEVLPALPQENFLFFVFTGAFLVSLVWFLLEGGRLTPGTLLMGAVIGLFNFGSAQFFLAALQEIPGMTAYPLNGIGVILASLVSGGLIWRERLKKHNVIFLISSIVGLLLLY